MILNNCISPPFLSLNQVKFVFLTVQSEEAVLHVTIPRVPRREQSDFKAERTSPCAVNHAIKLCRETCSRPKSAVKLMAYELHRSVKKQVFGVYTIYKLPTHTY